MANTIKFGNAQWATKKDSILAYNDENANFKPLPFVTSRASTATRVNKAGLLETVASGIPRVDYLSNTSGAYLLEPSSTNLITQSEAFANSYWIKSGASIQGDASTAGSDLLSGWNFTNGWNTLGSSTIIDSNSFSSSGGSGVRKDNFLVSGKNYTITISGNTNTTLEIRSYAGSVTYKLVTGTFSETFTFQSYDEGFYFRNSQTGTTNITSLLVKEVSGFASPSASSPLGAFKLVEDTSTGFHLMNSGLSAVTSGVNHTMSLYVKSSGSNLCLRENALTGDYATFDLTNGLVFEQTGVSANITLISNDWYRLDFTFLSGSNATYQMILLDSSYTSGTPFVSYTGDGTSGAYIFGAQLEQSSYATSYIPTAGSAITRLADIASQTVPDGIIGQTEGTIYSDVNFVGVTQSITNQIFFIRELNSNNGYIFAGFYQGKLNVGLRVGGSTKFDLLFGSVLTKGRYKIAVVYSSGDTKVFINGSKVGSTMTQTFGVNNFAQIYNGVGQLGTVQLGDINRDFRVYNAVLTDAEIVKLTTI